MYLSSFTPLENDPFCSTTAADTGVCETFHKHRHNAFLRLSLLLWAATSLALSSASRLRRSRPNSSQSRPVRTTPQHHPPPHPLLLVVVLMFLLLSPSSSSKTTS